MHSSFDYFLGSAKRPFHRGGLGLSPTGSRSSGGLPFRRCGRENGNRSGMPNLLMPKRATGGFHGTISPAKGLIIANAGVSSSLVTVGIAPGIDCPHPSIPIVPDITSCTSNLLALQPVGVDVHSHPTGVHLFRKDVLIFDVRDEDVVLVQAQKPSDIGLLS